MERKKEHEEKGTREEDIGIKDEVQRDWSG